MINDLIRFMSSRTIDVYLQIYEDIISGQLKPGQKVLITALAKKYGVGLSPIREALSQLTATDFIVAIAQKGFSVAPISIEDLSDIYETRSCIEQIALTLSIEKGTEVWEADLLSAFHKLYHFEIKQMINSIEQYKKWEERHRGFNLALMGACGLKYLLNIQSKIYKQTERYRRIWLLARISDGNMLFNAEKQKNIMEASLSRNKNQATSLLDEYYKEAKNLIANHLF